MFPYYGFSMVVYIMHYFKWLTSPTLLISLKSTNFCWKWLLPTYLHTSRTFISLTFTQVSENCILFNLLFCCYKCMLSFRKQMYVCFFNQRKENPFSILVFICSFLFLTLLQVVWRIHRTWLCKDWKHCIREGLDNLWFTFVYSSRIYKLKMHCCI